MGKKHRTRRKTRYRRRLRLYMRLGMFVLVAMLLVLVGMKVFSLGPFNSQYVEQEETTMHVSKPDIDVQLLTVNPYSRPGTQTEKIKNIVIHYTANPGTSAKQNRNYFENLKDTKTTKASSHFIIGLQGEIIQCIPTSEVAFASNNRNADTISIETCHPSENGTYTDATYDSLVHLTAWLCEKFQLTEADVIRHYDITGKICPKYFVEDTDAWADFIKDVKGKLGEK